MQQHIKIQNVRKAQAQRGVAPPPSPHSPSSNRLPFAYRRPVTISGTQQAVANAQMMVHNVCAHAAQYEFRQVPGMHQPQQPQQQPPPPFY